jgi:hypothetical protein
MSYAPQINLGERNEDAFIELAILSFELRIAKSFTQNSTRATLNLNSANKFSGTVPISEHKTQHKELLTPRNGSEQVASEIKSKYVTYSQQQPQALCSGLLKSPVKDIESFLRGTTSYFPLQRFIVRNTSSPTG